MCLFFFAFVIGIRPFDMKNRSVAETILVLSTAGNNQRDRETVNPIPMVNNAPRMLAPPITIPKPPPPSKKKKKIRRPPVKARWMCWARWGANWLAAPAVGSISPWSNASAAALLIAIPGAGGKLPNGSLVMVPTNIAPRLKGKSQSAIRHLGR